VIGPAIKEFDVAQIPAPASGTLQLFTAVAFLFAFFKFSRSMITLLFEAFETLESL